MKMFKFIGLKNMDRKESPRLNTIEHLLVELCPIIDDMQIPKDALNPEIWDIPEGYYAVMANSDNMEIDG